MGGAAVALRAICQKYKRLLIWRSFSGILRGRMTCLICIVLPGSALVSFLVVIICRQLIARLSLVQVFLEVNSASPLRKEIF